MLNLETYRYFIDTVIYLSFTNSLLYYIVVIMFGINYIKALHLGTRLKPN